MWSILRRTSCACATYKIQGERVESKSRQACAPHLKPFAKDERLVPEAQRLIASNRL